MSDLINLVIDGQPVSVPKGTLIIEAARKLDIEIPVYCYHPKLAPVGACRVCVVNVEKQRRPIMPACATEVAEGMVVHTRDAAATAAREGVLELLLINHPLDCPVCDRGGECDLQDFTLRYGPPKTRFTENKRHFKKSVQIGREVVLDRERCIMCMRCVRFCSEVAVEEGLTIIERGVKSEIGPFPGTSFDSQFSGNTVEICPVGALTSKSYRFRSRPWELQQFASVCPHCPVGCNLTVDVRYDEVVRFRSRVNDHIDDGWLCDRGRYGHGFIHQEGRLKQPLVGGKPATWEEALKAAAEGLKRFKPEEVGFVAGPRLGNEAAWNLHKLARTVIKTANLDHRRGVGFAPGASNLGSAKIEGCDTATCIVVVDCDPTKDAPVLDLRIKKGLRKGAGLVVIGSGGGLAPYADVALSSLAEFTKALDAYVEEEPPAIRHPKPRPWEPGGKTVSDAAVAAKLFRKSGRVIVVFHEDRGAEGLPPLVEGVEKPHGLLMLVKGANSVGLKEMGVTPWPGLEKAPAQGWDGYTSGTGKNHREMLDGGVKALVMMAEDELAKKPEFLIVCDLFLSDAAKQADVVFPASSFAEQAMTMTNLDGTVQLCRPAIPPVEGTSPDWLILHKLAAAMGAGWDTDSSAKIFAEIGRLNPLYPGASYAAFQTPASVHWSYPQQGKLGTPRPDLSAIPTRQPDASPWVASIPTGSRVENAGRLTRGDEVPEVPGQEDPRRVAARMSLNRALAASPVEIPEGAASRVLAMDGPQPPGPSPAQRYHAFGVQARHLPVTADLPQPESDEEPAT